MPKEDHKLPFKLRPIKIQVERTEEEDDDDDVDKLIFNFLQEQKAE